MRQLYEAVETDTALEALRVVAAKLPEPVVLLGGWAVRYTVNARFEEEHGQVYLGSRDVDLGFQIDPSWTPSLLARSTFAHALRLLREIGYIPHGTSRFSRIIHRQTREFLTETAASSIPQYDLVYQYVDPIVDRVHPQLSELFSIKPIDEPLLTRAFEERRLVSITLGKQKILLPDPLLLLAMKLSSLPHRDREDKKVKDACDIYSLLWYSPIPFPELIPAARADYPRLCESIRELTQIPLAHRAASHLGVETERFIGVVRRLLG